MKRFKLICLVLVLSVVSSLFTPVIADNARSSSTSEQIARAIEEGMIPPQLQGSYNRPITRYELAELITAFASAYTGLPTVSAVVRLNRNITGHFYKDTKDSLVDYAFSLGAFYTPNRYSDYGKTNFNASSYVKKQDMVYALYNFSKYMAKHFYTAGKPFADEKLTSDYALEAVRWAKANGIASGNGSGNFEPAKSITRQEAYLMMLALYEMDLRPFSEAKIDTINRADEEVLTENDYFILKIDKGFLYSKDLESQLLEGFKLAEEITGLSLYPDDYKDMKIVLESLENKVIATDSNYSLDQGLLLTNNVNNAVKYASIAAWFIFMRNAADMELNYHRDMYQSLVHYLANERLKICSENPHDLFFNSVTLNQLKAYTDKYFSTFVSYSYWPNANDAEYPFYYMFFIFLNERYGIKKVNEFVLETTRYEVSGNVKNEYAYELFDGDIKNQFIDWAEKNLKNHTYNGDTKYVTGNFRHESPQVNIPRAYNYMPLTFGGATYYVNLCFKADNKTTRINMQEAYNFYSYIGKKPEPLRLFLRCEKPAYIKTYNEKGKLISSNVCGGTGNQSNYVLPQGAYYEITGSGLIELNAWYTQ